MKEQYDFSKGKRGPVVRVPDGKEKITIRLDREIVDWFRNVVDKAAAATIKRDEQRARRVH